MDKRPSISSRTPNEPEKIYVILVGSAPMASLDALMLSLERFKNILSSDSARERFETTIRSIKSSLREVNQFIDDVYSEKNPNMSVTMTGRTLIIELNLSKDKFLTYIDSGKIDELLTHVIAVGTMPAKKSPNQTSREYTAFPVKYAKGKFIKFASV